MNADTYWTDKFGVKYDKDRLILVQAPKDLEEYIIPEGVKEIRARAFWSSKIKSITLPNSLLKIGESAFGDCRELASIHFPSSLKEIDDDAFACCSSLREVDLPDTLDCIGDGVFSYCFDLESITIGDNYKSIQWILTDNDIPEEDEEEVTGGNSMQSLGIISELIEYPQLLAYNKSKTTLFSVPKDIKEYTIPDTVTTIGKQAFGACRELEYITIPNSVTKILDEAFWACDSLKEVILPESIEFIGHKAFASCHELEKIIIPNDIHYLGYNSLLSCKNLRTLILPDIEDILEFILTKDSISKSDHTILSHLDISKNNHFSKSTVSTELETYTYLEAYNHSRTTLFSVPQDTENEYIVPDTVDTIYCKAFYNCKKIKSITLPNKITDFGDLAFENCEALEELKIHNLHYENTLSFECTWQDVESVYELHKDLK